MDGYAMFSKQCRYDSNVVTALSSYSVDKRQRHKDPLPTTDFSTTTSREKILFLETFKCLIFILKKNSKQLLIMCLASKRGENQKILIVISSDDYVTWLATLQNTDYPTDSEVVPASYRDSHCTLRKPGLLLNSRKTGV